MLQATGIVQTQDVYAALQRTTQALKDIMNAAHNGQPYTLEELQGSFTEDYNAGYEVLEALGIGEIS